MMPTFDYALERELLTLSQGTNLKYTRHEKISTYGIVTSARGGDPSFSTVVFKPKEDGCVAHVRRSPGMTRGLRVHEGIPSASEMAGHESFPLTGGFYCSSQTGVSNSDNTTRVLEGGVGNLIQDWCSGFDTRILLLGQRGCGKSSLAFGSPAMDTPCVSLYAVRKCFETLSSAGSLAVSLWSHDKNGNLSDLLGIHAKNVEVLDKHGGMMYSFASALPTRVTSVAIRTTDEAREVIRAGLQASGNFRSQHEALFPCHGEVHITLRLHRTTYSNENKSESSLLVFDAVGSSTSGTPSSLLLRLPRQLNSQSPSSFGLHYTGLMRSILNASSVQEMGSSEVAFSPSHHLVRKQVLSASKKIESLSLLSNTKATCKFNFPDFCWDVSDNNPRGPGLSNLGEVISLSPPLFSAEGPIAHFLVSPGLFDKKGALVSVLGVMSSDSGDVSETVETLKLLSQARKVFTRALRSDTSLNTKPTCLESCVDFISPVTFQAWGESLLKPKYNATLVELKNDVLPNEMPFTSSSVLEPLTASTEDDKKSELSGSAHSDIKVVLPPSPEIYETSFMAALRQKSNLSPLITSINVSPLPAPCEPCPSLFLESKHAACPPPSFSVLEKAGGIILERKELYYTPATTASSPCSSIGVQAGLLPPPSARVITNASLARVNTDALSVRVNRAASSASVSKDAPFACVNSDSNEIPLKISLSEEILNISRDVPLEIASAPTLQGDVGVHHHHYAASNIYHNWIADKSTTSSSGPDFASPLLPLLSSPPSPPPISSPLLPQPPLPNMSFPIPSVKERNDFGSTRDLSETLSSSERGRKRHVNSELENPGLPTVFLAARQLPLRSRPVRSLPSRPPKVASLAQARLLIRSLEESPSALSPHPKKERSFKRHPSAPPSLAKSSGRVSRERFLVSRHAERARLLLDSPLSPLPMEMALTRVITPLSPKSLKSSRGSEEDTGSESASSSVEDGRQAFVVPLFSVSHTTLNLPSPPFDEINERVSEDSLPKVTKESATSPFFPLVLSAQTQTEPLPLPALCQVEVQTVSFDSFTFLDPPASFLIPFNLVNIAVQTETLPQPMQKDSPVVSPSVSLAAAAAKPLDLSSTYPPPPLPSTPSRSSPPPLRHTPGKDAISFSHLFRGPLHSLHSPQISPSRFPRQDVTPSRGSVLLSASPNVFYPPGPTLENTPPLFFLDACVRANVVDKLDFSFKSETKETPVSLPIQYVQALAAADEMLVSKNLELKASQTKVDRLEDTVLDLTGRLSGVIAALRSFTVLDDERDFRDFSAEKRAVELASGQQRGIQTHSLKEDSEYGVNGTTSDLRAPFDPLTSPSAMKSLAAAAKGFAKKLRRSLSLGAAISCSDLGEEEALSSPRGRASKFLDPLSPTPSPGLKCRGGFPSLGLVGEKVASPISGTAISNESAVIIGAELRASLARAVKVAEFLLDKGLGVLRGQLKESRQRGAQLHSKLETLEPELRRVALYKRIAEAASRGADVS